MTEPIAIEQLWLLTASQLSSLVHELARKAVGCELGVVDTELGDDLRKKYLTRLYVIDRVYGYSFVVDVYYRPNHLVVDLIRSNERRRPEEYVKLVEIFKATFPPAPADSSTTSLAVGTFETGPDTHRGGYVVAVHVLQLLKAHEMI